MVRVINMKKSIEDIYGGFAKGRVFIEYCHSKSLYLMDDLDSIDFSQLGIPGIGVPNIIKIEQIYLGQREVERQSENDFIDIPLLIEDVFQAEKKGLIFIEYCHSKGMRTMNELQHFQINHTVIPGIGKGGKIILQERYNQVREEFKEMIETELLDGISEDNYYIELSRVITREEDQYLFLKYGLYNKNIRDLQGEIIDKEDIYQLKKLLVPFRASKIDFFYNQFKKMNSSRNEEIFLQRAEGKTLSVIGENFDMTRERVRQICAKIVRKMSKEAIILLDALIENENRGIFLSELRWKLQNHQRFLILREIIMNLEEYTYFSFSDRLVKSTCVPKDFFRQLNEKIESLLDDRKRNFHQLSEELSEYFEFPFMDKEEVDDYLQYQGYVINGTLVTSTNPPLGVLGHDAILNYFDFDIALNGNENNWDMEELRKILAKFYGREVESNNRSLTAALTSRSGSRLILSGRGRFCPIEKVEGNKALFHKIYNFILESPKQPLYFSDLFEIFKDSLLTLTNVNNQYMLHGIFRYYYEESLDFSRETVSKRGVELVSMDLQIMEILEKSRRVLHLKDLVNIFPSITKVRMSFTHSRNNEIIYLGENMYVHIHNVVYDQDYGIFIQERLNRGDGYISSENLYDDFKEYFPEFLTINSILSSKALTEILDAKYGDRIKFKHPHILSRDFTVEDINVFEIAKKQLNWESKISIEEYLDYAKRMKWSNQIIYLVFSRLNKEYIRISKDEYIHQVSFSINQFQIDSVKKFLANTIYNNFLPISQISNYDNFPDIGLEWNEFLIEEIVERYVGEWRIISPINKDYRYQKGIIIKQDLKIKTLEELAIWILVEDGNQGYTLEQMVMLLTKRLGIKKVIPYEILHSKLLTIQDELYFVANKSTPMRCA